MKKLLINGEVIEHVGPIEWSDDLESMANTINFTTDDQIPIGSKFALMDGANEVMRGIVSDYTQNEPNRFSYAGYDFGFYLNKNSIIKQFNGMNISDAFKVLCTDFNIPVGAIPAMSATVKKIYKKAVLSDVFREFLELNKSKTGKDYYYFTCANGAFTVKKFELIEDLEGSVGESFTAESTNTIMSPSISVSMEDLKNRVVVTDNASDSVSKQIILSASDSISKYGLLQHVEQVDTDKNNNLNGVAQTKLTELNTLKTTIDLTMLGDYRMRKGVITPIKNELLSLSGDFLIKASRHTLDKHKETVAVNLIKYDRSKLQ